LESDSRKARDETPSPEKASDTPVNAMDHTFTPNIIWYWSTPYRLNT
jgi:hypothetical protein